MAWRDRARGILQSGSRVGEGIKALFRGSMSVCTHLITSSRAELSPVHIHIREGGRAME